MVIGGWCRVLVWWWWVWVGGSCGVWGYVVMKVECESKCLLTMGMLWEECDVICGGLIIVTGDWWENNDMWCIYHNICVVGGQISIVVNTNFLCHRTCIKTSISTFIYSSHFNVFRNKLVSATTTNFRTTWSNMARLITISRIMCKNKFLFINKNRPGMSCFDCFFKSAYA